MLRSLSVFVLIIGFIAIDTTCVDAQDGLPGGLDGGQLDAGALENQIFDAVGQDGGTAGTGGLGGGDDGGGFEFDDLFNFDNFGDADQSVANERDSPFVGVTNGEVPEGFNGLRHIGPLQQEIGGNGATGAGLGTRGGAGNRGGGLGGGQNNGGLVIERQSVPVRSRVIPRFSSRGLSPGFVSRQINQRFSPANLNRPGLTANVSVQGRTAILTGNARSREQASVLSRQLRFEPGISRVRNRMQFGR